MSALVYVGLANAVCAALLASVALLVGRFCRRPAVLHSLWMLVLLKLVTPPFWPVTVANLPEEPAAAAQTAPPPEAMEYTILTQHEPVRAEPMILWANVEQEQPVPNRFVTRAKVVDIETQTDSSRPAKIAAPPSNAVYKAVQVIPPAAPSAKAPAPEPPPQTLEACLRLLGIVWLAGMVVWFAWAGLHVCGFQRLLRHARPASLDIQEQARQLAGQMGMKRCPEIWLLPGPLPPLVWAAVGRVRVFFPSKLLERLDEMERGSLLAHELAHVCRRDHWVRWLELIAAGLFWWYPLVWLARKRLHVHEEECCDAWVIGEVPARSYATAIMNTLDFLAEDAAPLPVMASGLAGIKLLKRRLSLILGGETPKRLSWRTKLALVFAGLLLLSVRPNLAQTEKKPAESAEKPTKQPAERPAAKRDAVPLDVPVAPAAPAEELVVFNQRSRNLLGGTSNVQSANGLNVRGEDRSLDSVPLAIAASLDGKTLALALEDHTAQLRDAATGNLRFTLKGHEDSVTCVVFAADGKTLATGSPDRTVRLWDTVSGELRRTLTGHTSWVYALAFSPDGKTLASAGYDKTIRLWDPDTGEVRRTLKGHKASIRALAFSPDGKTLASGSGDRTIKLWPMAEGEPATLTGHSETIRALAFSPDGKTLASGSDDRTIKLWDMATKSERTTLKGHTGEVMALTFSPKGRTLVTGAADNTIFLWDAAAGTQAGQLRGHNDGVTGVLFAPDGQHLLSAGIDRTVKIWSPLAPSERARLTLRAHKDHAWAVAFSPDNRMLASVSGMDKSGELKLFESATGKALVVLKEARGIRCAAFSPDGKTLATGGFDATIQLREAPTGRVFQILKGHSGGVNSLSFSPDGRRLLTGSLDKTAKVWDLKTGENLTTLIGHQDWVLSVAFAPDGKTVATASKDRTARLWNVADGKLRLTLSGHTEGIEAVTFAPNGKTVATASWDQTVRLWDAMTGRLRSRLQGQRCGFLSLAFTSDGKTLATASGHYENQIPGELRLWDVATARPVRVLQGHTKGIWCVRFAPDGKTLASVSDDGIVKLWSMRAAPRPSAARLLPNAK